MSVSDVRIGTNGAFIERDIKAFQFTFSNHGWLRIYSELVAPKRSFGFFSSKRIKMFWSFGEAFIIKKVHLEPEEVDKG